MDYSWKIKLEGLVKLINEAENHSEALNAEIKQIKKEISSILSPSLDSSANNVLGHPSTSSNRRKLENDDIMEQNNKIPRNEKDVSIVFACGIVVNKNSGIGVWIAENHGLNISKSLGGTTYLYEVTFHACYEALNLMKNLGRTSVEICVDNEIVVNGFTIWIQKWKVNNWQTADGSEVKCKDIIQRIDLMVGEFREVKWVFVENAHGMKEAKKLALKGAKK